jgi:thiamine-phosphate pyrophosphorylase
LTFAGRDPDRGRWRRHRLDAALLYVITGTRGDQGDLEAFLDGVLRGGADIIQLRDKHATVSSLLSAGAVFKEAADRHEALFIVNDRPDVALALDADGVHLGQDDLSPGLARPIVGPDAIIGLSTHSRAQFAGSDAAADYLCAGPVYATPTKQGRPATGLDLIRNAATLAADERERRPWFAIGGIDADRLPQVLAAGADRVVVVRAITDAADPRAAARELTDTLR